jgi:CxxC-x17-CxxC domain-containing protein
MGFFKSDRSAGGNSDKKYGKGGFGGGKSFGGKSFGGRSFGGRDGARPEMHSAICSECDKECEVPFKPIGDKPIFCRSCFKAQGDRDGRDFESKKFGKRDFDDRKGGGSSSGFSSGGITKEQYEKLNNKLDKILAILEANG